MGRRKGRGGLRAGEPHGTSDEDRALIVGDDDAVVPFARRLRDAVVDALDPPRRMRIFPLTDNSDWPVRALKVASDWRITARDTRERPVLPLSRDDLWVSAEILLHSRLSVWFLRSTSIRVFGGPAVDASKTPLFRAEWDFDDRGRTHAQPHWQIYDRDATRQSGDLPAFDAAGHHARGGNGLAPEPHSGQQKLGRFHFALAARWHLDGVHVAVLQTPHDVSAWVARCIGYIKSEMERPAGYQ
jgi:hypothetical protein